MTAPSTFSIPPRVLESLGTSRADLCARAGVALSNRWETQEFFRLWAAAEDMFDDRSAGLRFGTEGIVHGYAVAAVVALHAPDVRRALAALSRYKRLTCPESVEVEIGRDEVIVRYRWLEATGAVPRLLVDTTMASLKELLRLGTAGQATPVRLELTRRPADEALLRRHFGCPIVFGALHDAMVFSREVLDMPFVTADAGVFAAVLARFENEVAATSGFYNVVADLRIAIGRQLSEGGRPSIDDIARKLGVSSRTLQRRLDESGTSFQEQLSSVRHTLASRLLVNTDLDTIAISMLLGFAEPNSFARAFRSWERTTPLRWREHHTVISSSAKEAHQ